MSSASNSTVPTSPVSNSNAAPPELSKRALSLFFRVGCERQFLLYLYDDAGRARQKMPPRQGGRAGMGLVGKHGHKHQADRVEQLKEAFGKALHVGPVVGKNGETRAIPLEAILTGGAVTDYDLVAEPAFDGETQALRSALGLQVLCDLEGSRLAFKELRPDLIQVLPPLARHRVDVENLDRLHSLELRPDGSVKPIDDADSRRRLRVLDIKLASEPGAHYFAEVVFYAMALSAWLIERGLDKNYIVVAAPAVVPGSYEPSALLNKLTQWKAVGHTASAAELSAAFEDDLSTAPVEAFAPRIRDLLCETLARLLKTSWQDVPYHVDFRCRGCEFLGDPHIHDRNNLPTQHVLHCWAQAEANSHLSQVVGLSRGASDVLRSNAIADVSSLAGALPASEPGGVAPGVGAFAVHHGLRAKRTVYPARARALVQGVAGVITDSGGDALMPRWPALRVFVFLDYDPATAITATFGLRAHWEEPLPYESTETPKKRKWGRAQGDTEVFVGDLCDCDTERREFLRFLSQLRTVFNDVEAQDRDDCSAQRRDSRTRNSTYQIYLWDEAQRRHLLRLVSRHLAAILREPTLRGLAWLFPPPDLLAFPEISSRRTPYTIVHDVVQHTVALPSPHHYTLLEVARAYNTTGLSSPNPHPLYVDTLSNLAPPERIHEMWTRAGNWREVQDHLAAIARQKLVAMALVVSSLERDLGNQLARASLSAPRLPSLSRRPPSLAPESELWLEFTRLNASLESLEMARIRVMPVHEREARFKSARLTRKLRGAERQRAWSALVRQLPRAEPLNPSILIYALSPQSLEFPARAGDFNYALAPADDPGFLDRSPVQLTENTPIEKIYGDSVADAQMTAVSIVAIDRVGGNLNEGLIALALGKSKVFRTIARHVRIDGRRLDFTHDVTLDPVHRDFLTSKVNITLTRIGNPPLAKPNSKVLAALGWPPTTPAGTSRNTPAAEVLWDALRLRNEPSGRDGIALTNELEARLNVVGRRLTPDQALAVQEGLGRRLTLVLGPPGTGKSYTLRAIVLGALIDAAKTAQPLRILVTANTYTAVDNVLLKLQEDLRDLAGAHIAGGTAAGLSCKLIRIQSSSRPVEHDFVKKFPDVHNFVLDWKNPTAEVKGLIDVLNEPNQIVVVGAPTQQIHNLGQVGGKSASAPRTQRAWFDLMILDEASQVDVATSTLVFSKRASQGACILAGDDRQLPPIHQADPPLGLEAHVGSIYTYLHNHLQVPVCSLQTSFRSNNTLVALTRNAGYSGLHAHSPDLTLDLCSIPSTAPLDWPTSLPWSADYARILDPERPAVCLVHEDRQSAQANSFEADHVAALLELLRRNLKLDLLHELDAFGASLPSGRGLRADPPKDFLADQIGVVVPHRAQMSAIIGRLRPLFPPTNFQALYGAVDTVERFQGQERDVIIASFGVGDPDVIASEEEFLYSLQRFNVMVSRARAKLIVFVSRSVVEYLSDEKEVLAQSLLLKRFVEEFCEPAPANPSCSRSGAPWMLRWNRLRGTAR